MISKLMAKASVTGVLAGLVMTAPAVAATAPTLGGPASRVGFGPVTLGGTAAPGATVELYETAIVFDDLQPADDWEHGGGALTATADASGHWQLQRMLDSGFYFQVEADGLRSTKITVRIQQLVTLTVTSPSAGAVRAHVTADPAQPGLPVQVQTAGTSGSWTTLSGGYVSDAGAYDATIAKVGSGAHTFRAYIGADPANGVLAGYSTTHTITVAGAPGSTPKPSTPGPGSVQFSGAQYNSPGADSGSNASLNGEWVRLSNKTAATVDLKGWTVRDEANHVYTFGSFRLGGGRSVYLRTGKGTNSTSTRYWGRTGYIWNNGGDTATLRTGAGKTIDTCKWGADSGYTAC